MRHVTCKPDRGTRLLAPAAFLAVSILSASSGCGGLGNSGDTPPAASECEEYPTNDIELIIPFSPGGGYDNIGRRLAKSLERNLPNDTQVVVRNVEGGGGMRGTTRLYGATPDGYTLEFASPDLYTSELRGEAGPVDFRNFTYLSRVAIDTHVILVPDESPIKSFDDLKSQSQNRLKVATNSPTLKAIDAVLFSKLELRTTTVRHEGSGQAVLSMIRGDTDITGYTLQSVAEYIKSGEVRPILLVGGKPAKGEPGYSLAKGVPTAKAVGLNELLKLKETRVVMAPPDMPTCIRQKLSQGLVKAQGDQRYVEGMKEAGRTRAPLGTERATNEVMQKLDTMDAYKEIIR